MEKHTLTGKPEVRDETLEATYPMESDRASVGDGLANRNTKYVEGESLVNMVKDDLAARRIGLGCCRDIIHYLGDHDPDTRRKLEDVLSAEGERAGEAANRLKL